MWYTKSVEEVARELRTNTKFRVKGKMILQNDKDNLVKIKLMKEKKKDY